MTSKTVNVKRCAAVVIQAMVLTCAIIAGPSIPPAYCEDEAIQTTCFKKEAEDGVYVGNVSVTRPETAAVNCNATYYDCMEKCIGCYTDQTLNRTVCYNAGGEKVPQEGWYRSGPAAQ